MSINQQLVNFCFDEWEFFGKPEIRLDGTSVDGKKEYEDGAWQRIADYWQFIGGQYKNLTGKDRGYPWSAAFVSFCMHHAGAGTSFPYAAGHYKYINESIRNRDNPDACLIGHRPKEYSLKPGDLIGYWRGNRRITIENARNIGWYESHTEIVVGVENRKALTIGGNVGHSVTLREVRLNSNNNLVDRKNNWFIAIENRIN